MQEDIDQDENTDWLYRNNMYQRQKKTHMTFKCQEGYNNVLEIDSTIELSGIFNTLRLTHIDIKSILNTL